MKFLELLDRSLCMASLFQGALLNSPAPIRRLTSCCCATHSHRNITLLRHWLCTQLLRSWAALGFESEVLSRIISMKPKPLVLLKSQNTFGSCKSRLSEPIFSSLIKTQKWHGGWGQVLPSFPALSPHSQLRSSSLRAKWERSMFSPEPLCQALHQRWTLTQ